MFRVGIIGTGFMAVTHLKAWQQISGARISALCSPSGRHLNGDFSGVFGNVGSNDPFKLDMTGVTALREWRELVQSSDIDLVDICSPTLTHPDIAIAALGAGRHVICEKPLARTSSDAARIAAAAVSARGYFLPAMCLRFWPEWAWLREAISGGRYGPVLSARFRRVAEPPQWSQDTFLDGRKSGGALLDLHIHDTDFVQSCFGRPSRVYSTGYSKLSGAIDHVVTQYRVKSGAIVHAEGSWAMTPGFGFNMSYTVNFASATADYDMARASEALRLIEPGQSPRTISCPGPDGYGRELRHMVECIGQGKPPWISTVSEAVSAIEICEAEERSIATGEPVAL